MVTESVAPRDYGPIPGQSRIANRLNWRSQPARIARTESTTQKWCPRLPDIADHRNKLAPVHCGTPSATIGLRWAGTQGQLPAVRGNLQAPVYARATPLSSKDGTHPMNHRVIGGLAIIALAVAPVRSFSDTTPLVVIDAHNDTVQNLVLDGADFGRRSSQGGIDLSRLREGGVTVPFFAANVPVYYPKAEAVRRTLDFRDAGTVC